MTQDNDNGKQNIVSKPEGKQLNDYEGVTVTAYCGEFPRNEGFPIGMSVNGELEYNSDRDQYRILVSTGNYTYFTSKDVVEVRAGEEHTFKDGAEAVVFLELEQGVQ